MVCISRNAIRRKHVAQKRKHIGSGRRLGARFCAIGYLEGAGVNASERTSHFRSFRVLLSIIAYTKWNFREMDVSRAFVKTKPLAGNIYVAPPYFRKQTRILGGS